MTLILVKQMSPVQENRRKLLIELMIHLQVVFFFFFKSTMEKTGTYVGGGKMRSHLHFILFLEQEMKSLWEMRKSQSTFFGSDFLTPKFSDYMVPPDCTSLGYLEIMLLQMDLEYFS